MHEVITSFIKHVVTESLCLNYSDSLLCVREINIDSWDVGICVFKQNIVFANVSRRYYNGAYDDVKYVDSTEVLGKDLTVIKYVYSSDHDVVYLYTIQFKEDSRVKQHLKGMIYNIVDISLLTETLELSKMRKLYESHVEYNDWEIPDDE